MKKLLLLIVALSAATALFAQGGIRFEHAAWKEVKEKAIQENKLIFADFFTEWCGPCLMMAEEVFPLMEVGNFYNAHFVNVKIDAEKGEGLTLREKYKIQSYPTFLFIDPKTEEIVHRSSSRQEAAVFLFTGESAVTPEMRSFYLEKEYAAGNRQPVLVCHYMDYLASVYRRDELDKVVSEYIGRPEFSLENRKDWEVFVKHISGRNSAPFKQVLEQKEKYDALYGKTAVDAKLYKEFNYTPMGELAVLKAAPDFRGKDFLIQKNEAEEYVRAKDYEKAGPLIEKMMENPGEFKEELCNYLKFVARSVLYGEHSSDWMKQCARYAQYVAYNSYNRQDATVHFDYAQILEKLIKQLPDAGRYFPESIVNQPEYGSKTYSMRPPQLKQKPKRNRK